MEIQVATLCDAAADYSGKLSLMGAFDTIASRETPIIHPQCALAIRMCFRPEDEGKQKLRVAFVDSSGADVMPPFEPELEVRMPSPGAGFITHNLVVNIQRLKFDTPGYYAIDVRAGDKVIGNVPLRVLLVDEEGRPIPLES